MKPFLFQLYLRAYFYERSSSSIKNLNVQMFNPSVKKTKQVLMESGVVHPLLSRWAREIT
jgi:hypothetical protein